MKIREFCIRKLLVGFGLAALLFVFSPSKAQAQMVVDKTVATVGDGIGVPELITYSDLLWQLALQPRVSLLPPTSEELLSLIHI